MIKSLLRTDEEENEESKSKKSDGEKMNDSEDIDESEIQDENPDNLKEQLEKYIDVISTLFSSDEDFDEDIDKENRTIITRPSAKSVAEQAHENIIGEFEKDEENINFPYDDPREVLTQFELEMAEIRDDIINELDEYERKEKESADGSDINTLSYVISRNAGKSKDFTILGGGKSVIYNLSNDFKWTDIETDLMLEAQEVAAKENDFQKHLLMDTCIIIPNSSEIAKKA